MTITPLWNSAPRSTDASDMTAREAMDAAGLSGWDVRTDEITLSSNDGTELDVRGWRALTRSGKNGDGTRRLLSNRLVENSYVPIQNEEVFEQMVPMLVGSNLRVSSAGILGTLQARAYISFRGDDIEVPGGEAYQSYLFAVANHSGRDAVHIGATAVRIYCTNTERLARVEAAQAGNLVTIRHNRQDLARFYANPESSRNILNLSHNYAKRLREMATVLQSVPFDGRQFKIVIQPPPSETQFTEARLQDLMDAWETEERRAVEAGQFPSLWTARQAVSTWAQHTLRGGSSRSLALALPTTSSIKPYDVQIGRAHV